MPGKTWSEVIFEALESLQPYTAKRGKETVIKTRLYHEEIRISPDPNLVEASKYNLVHHYEGKRLIKTRKGIVFFYSNPHDLCKDYLNAANLRNHKCTKNTRTDG